MSFIATKLHADIKEKLLFATHSLSRLAKDIKHIPLLDTISELVQSIDEPFLFVIVGEVKAGKSSFINALLDTKEDICKVAPSPMTDTIQQITYGETKKEETINPYLKKIYYPAEILKEITIVDTPGTNTIVDHHQEITQRYIPQADLIVFVFESKNPYRQSAWEFFDFINDEWRKKVIFVLQQKDLMEPEDLVTNIEGVRSHALAKEIKEPKVFDVSAKMKQKGDYENSGFVVLEKHIKENITGGKAILLKYENYSETIANINDKISTSLQLRIDQYAADIQFREDIKVSLTNQEKKTIKQSNFLVENLLAAYDKITNSKIKELEEGLSILPLLKKSFGSIFSMGQSPKEWLKVVMKDFEQELNIGLKNKLQNGVIDIAENIQTMAILVDAKLKNSQTILDDSDEIFSDIANKRANVLKELQETFRDFMSNSENFYDQEILNDSNKMAPNVAAGSGLAVIGVILATLTNGAVFDITGGILTTVGILFAGASIGYKRRQILNSFKAEIAAGRSKIEKEVTDKLIDYTQRIKYKIDQNFFKFDQYLQTEQSVIERLQAENKSISSTVEEIKQEVLTRKTAS